MDTSSQLDLKDLHLVRAIAERDGVTAAARSLHLSQSAVSHHLARIEARLGVPLFQRVGRKLRITAAGNQLVALSHELGARMAAVESEIRRGAARRQIRLSTQCYTTYHWLPPLLNHFSAETPGVQVRIAFDATRDPVEQLREGRLDLALCHSQAFDGRFKVVPLMADPMAAAVSTRHPLASRKRLRARDFEGETLLVHDLPAATLREEGRTLFADTAGPARVERIPLTEAILELVRAGRGVSIMSRWALTPYVDVPDIAVIPMSGPHTTRTWRAVYEARSPLREPIEALVECIRSGRFGQPGAGRA